MSQDSVVQVIDFHGKFNPDLSEKLTSWSFIERGSEYFVVAVLGCQSSGKSTLLNKLFNTPFEVLNIRATKGKKQTTQGVWLGKAQFPQNYVLVFDVEGTDSKERGEDHGAWERKTSLFSLALSEILIINMWTKDLGRYDGANYGLLKNVFELNLKLFQGGRSGKTLLYFVLRDYLDTEAGDLHHISETILNDMNKLWSDMQKPDMFKNSKVTDFFDFRAFAITYMLKTEEWNSGILSLRETFTDSKNPNFVLDNKYKSGVPADGFCHYAGKIWETILSDKDLDLPSQKQMLAIFRCDEISEVCFGEFKEKIVKLTAVVDNNEEIQNLGLEGKLVVQEIMGDYDTKTKLYDAKVREDKRGKLLERLCVTLGEIFKKQMEVAIEKCRKKFDESLQITVPEKEPMKNLGKAVNKISEDIAHLFSQKSQAALVPDFNWPIKPFEDILRSYMQDKIRALKKLQTNLWFDYFRKTTQSKLSNNLGAHFTAAKENMWHEIIKHYNAEKNVAAAEFEDILKDHECTEQEAKVFRSDLEVVIFEALRAVVSAEVRNLEAIMTAKFLLFFEHGPDGTPRRWNSVEEVLKEWKVAKSEAEKALDLFSVVRINPKYKDVKMYKQQGDGSVTQVDDIPMLPEEVMILSPSEGVNVLQRFRKHADNSYKMALVEAERAAAHASMPPYMMWLLLALGWNEIWWVLQYVLFSPLGFLLAVLFGVFAYFVYSAGAWPTVRTAGLALLKQIESSARAQVGLYLKSPAATRETKKDK